MNGSADSFFAVQQPRRRLAKSLIAVACFFAVCGIVVSAMVLAGVASFPNAHPGLTASPLNHLLGYGLLTAILLLIYRRIGRGESAASA